MNRSKNHKNEAKQCSDCIDKEPVITTALSEGTLTTSLSTVDQARFRIPSMDCASEEAEIRRALAKIDAIKSLRFNLGARELIIDADANSIPLAMEAIKKSGFETELILDEKNSEVITASPKGFWSSWGKPIAGLVLAVAAEVLEFAFTGTQEIRYLGMALAGLSIALTGLDVYIKGLKAFNDGRLNINALMTIAVTGAFFIGQWPEAAMVMALYAIAEAIEAKAVDRARNAIKSLMELTPEDAEVLQSDGAWKRELVKDIPIDAKVRIRPGERIPLDGIVISGQSAIDQSPVTGESLPVDKSPNDQVFAGTINQAAELEIRITALSSNSTISRIINAVEQAQGSRAPTQRFVDSFAAIYTPAVFVLALIVALWMPFLLEWTWMKSIYKALVLLVIACPCALVISTPVTVVSGLAAAARRGILIKGGVYLEEARKIKAVALDKTGTITEGKPKLSSFDVFDVQSNPTELKSIAYSLASRSDHPVSKAIAEGLSGQTKDVKNFKAVAGRGVQAKIGNSTFFLGNHRWIEEMNLCSSELEMQLAKLENAGRTVSLLATFEKVLAVCSVADTIKSSSKEAVSDLIRLGVTPVMLTGDNLATAKTVGIQAGINEVKGNLLPEDKLKEIEFLQKQFGVTAMTGDGINDAPSLARADIGFAMGAAGTHTAMEAADVLVMNDDLRRLPETIRLSKQTHAILWQNIALALGIKFVFLYLALFDNASMWMAVFADMGASLLVVFNGLRLIYFNRQSRT
ncbi:MULTISPECIES: cation-translocating P-type ATPase [unclassified Methylophilus]|uniref:heavy metal translocating P-type ATPase n=1 Tax=unclassified Methylophilus TaxID=2630143 RepID=UPI00039E1B38|nr:MULTISPECIES: heavy metal translocating P-type ATPase [unclassified Methylophilus]